MSDRADAGLEIGKRLQPTRHPRHPHRRPSSKGAKARRTTPADYVKRNVQARRTLLVLYGRIVTWPSAELESARGPQGLAAKKKRAGAKGERGCAKQEGEVHEERRKRKGAGGEGSGGEARRAVLKGIDGGRRAGGEREKKKRGKEKGEGMGGISGRKGRRGMGGRSGRE
eukprot:6186167-Pleurochrysis_carterae.AAC.1